jgi:hypothetical protein
MSQQPTGFDLCLPGIVAGLMLAAVVLTMGEALFPDPFQQVFPSQAFVVLPVAIGAASALGLVSLFFHSRGDDEKPRQHIPSDDSKKKNSLLSGGTDAL